MLDGNVKNIRKKYKEILKMLDKILKKKILIR